MSEYCKYCAILSDQLTCTIDVLEQTRKERDRFADQLADMKRVPANAWRCTCGLVVKKGYTCMGCGMREP